MLLGKNLMPYLNKKDHRTVNQEYQQWYGVKKKKQVRNKTVVKEMARQVSHAKHLDMEFSLQKRKMEPLNDPLILRGRDSQKTSELV